MYRLVVCYHQPEDPAAFDNHYNSTHAPMAAKIPGLLAYTVGHGESLDGSAPPYYLVAELDFESKAAMGQGMGSAEGAAAVGDLPNFAGGGVTMFSYDAAAVV